MNAVVWSTLGAYLLFATLIVGALAMAGVPGAAMLALKCLAGAVVCGLETHFHIPSEG